MSQHPVVIVGGVAGGMSAAARLRRLDESQEIIVLERGDYVSFANCGLPYYVGGVIDDRDALILNSPEFLAQRFNLDVRVRNEATAIDVDAHTVTVNSPQGSYELTYSSLLLAPGAEPIKLPIDGADRALSIRNLADIDRVVARLADGVESAVVLGGGFIGVEMADNLHKAGCRVTIVEAAPHILAPLDEEIAAFVDNHLHTTGISVVAGHRAVAITDEAVQLDNGDEVRADLVVSAVGVSPDSQLAREAGIECDSRGGILVDELQRTSAADVYAVGDAVVKLSRITGQQVHVPLANAANRDGRRVADVIAGHGDRSQPLPVTPTAIVDAAGLTVASTGLNERAARQAGLDVACVTIHPMNHVTYYPGASQMVLKLVYNPQDFTIYGAQAVGHDGVDKRIDVVATAIAGGIPADQLAGIDLAYAPQYGAAKDPVTMLGFVVDNAAHGLTTHESVVALADGELDSYQLVDVRTPGEYAAGRIGDAVNLPVDQLRQLLAHQASGADDSELAGDLDEYLPALRQLSTDTPLAVYCGVGVRAHTAIQLLKAYGYTVINIAGGWRSWQALKQFRLRHGRKLKVGRQ